MTQKLSTIEIVGTKRERDERIEELKIVGYQVKGGNYSSKLKGFPIVYWK